MQLLSFLHESDSSPADVPQAGEPDHAHAGVQRLSEPLSASRPPPTVRDRELFEGN